MTKRELRLEALRLAVGRYPPTMSDEDQRVLITAESYYTFLVQKSPSFIDQLKASIKELQA